MGLIGERFSRYLCVVLVCTLLMPTSALASPKPLTPTQVHARILKRGIGNWVGVEVMSGAAFGGRIVSIDDQSFGLQLYDDPAITPVFYHDVVSLHMGLTQRGFWTITAVGAAGAVVFALVAHHEFESFKNSEPVLPTQPTQPVFPY